MDGDLLRYNKDIKICFCDTETMNLNLSFRFNRPWNIGILNVKGNEILEAKDIRIDWKKSAPNLKIGNDAARITHFNPEEHEKLALQPGEAFKLFWEDLKDCDYIVCHNILRFDIYLLKGYAEFMGEKWKWIVNKIIDTNSLVKGIKLGIPYTPKQGNLIEYQYRISNIIAKGVKTNIKYLCSEYGFEYDENKAHSALYDCYKNKEILDKIKYQIEL